MNLTRYEELIAQINKMNFHYYTKDEPLVSDREYDLLYDELLSIEKLNPDWVNNSSPSQLVGGDLLAIFEKKEHTTPLYSLAKAQINEELEKFFKDVLQTVGNPKTIYSLEQKMDGIAFVARYENGYFVEARTRGNGAIGEIITSQIRTIKSIPKEVPYKGTFEIQGEVYMPNDKFTELNQSIENNYRLQIGHPSVLSVEQQEKLHKLLFKNARNATGGSLRNLDTKVTASRGLETYAYNIPYIEGENFSTQTEMMEFLKEQNFAVNPYYFTIETFDEAAEKITEMIAVRPTLNYDIDGMVLKVDRTDYRDRLGFTSKYPKWAIAWKFEAEQAETPLLSVQIETKRTGKISPVGLLEPVEIGGVTVTKATLNNYEWIEERDLKFALGATVIVRRSNDVIPEILGVSGGSVGEELLTPTHCPECESELVKEGVHLYCKNTENCDAQQIDKIIHFASRNAMNIDTLADKTAEQLWDGKLIRNIVDLYRLKKADLLILDRFGETKADKLLKAIEKSKKQPLSAFIYALGIRHVGEGTVDRLLRYYDTLEKIMSANINDFMEIEDIGDSVAKSLYEYFHNEKTVATLKELNSLGVEMLHHKKETASSLFNDLVFVVTGTMPSGRNRDKIESVIKENGGKISKSISAKTSFLVAGTDAGSKLTKAQQIEEKTKRKIILTEDEFDKMLN